MPFPPKFRATSALLIAVALLCPPAHALVSFNDGADHLYFTGTFAVEHDSNIFAHAGGPGDTIYSAGVLLEYTRRAGMIAVDATVALDASNFTDNSAQNFKDPRFRAEFTKSSGRTTGSLLLGAAHVSEADTLANTRTQSWNYDADLKFKYPVIERYSFAGSLAFTDRVYDDSPAALADLKTFTAGADLLYTIDSRRDFVAGYQYRHSETSANSTFDDHSFTAGLNAKIVSKLNANLRVGYQVRNPTGSTTVGSYHGLTASGSLSWNINQKWSLTGQLARDVSVTADNQSVDTGSAGLTLRYARSDRLTFSSNVGTGINRFLDPASGRRDTFFKVGAGLEYRIQTHLNAALAYDYDENWSTLSYSDFNRHIFSLSLSSKW